MMTNSMNVYGKKHTRIVKNYIVAGREAEYSDLRA